MRFRHAGVVVAFIAATLLAGCGARGAREAGGEMSDAAFDKVELDTRTSNACSPDVDFAEFRGIAIAMPKAIPLGKLSRVPVCGTYSFTTAQFEKLPEFPYGLSFLVRDLESNETFNGHFTSDEIPPDSSEVSEGPGASAAEADTLLGGYFNVNLVPAWQAPRRPGRYRIVFTVHEWASAPVDFEVVK